MEEKISPQSTQRARSEMDHQNAKAKTFFSVTIFILCVLSDLCGE
jgi:hypothetical protein